MPKSKRATNERQDRFATGALFQALALAVLMAASGRSTALAQEQTHPLPAPAAVASPTVPAPPVPAPTVASPAASAGTVPASVLPDSGAPAGPPLPDPSVMPAEAAIAAPAVAVTDPESDLSQHDLSPMGMFYAADPVVKGVMILLALASVATWTVLFVRGFGLMVAKARLKRSLRMIREAGSLAEASAKVSKGVGGLLLHEAAEEARLSQGLSSEGIKERVHIALSRVETAVGRRMAFGTGLLATVGSVGPFVGLFGTVWGIMRSFIGIANSNTTNLAVVAPGIAEALLATGIGLVAAIPAVVIYNSVCRSVSAYRVLMGDAAALILRHLSRDLDRHAAGSSVHEHGNMRMAAE